MNNLNCESCWNYNNCEKKERIDLVQGTIVRVIPADKRGIVLSVDEDGDVNLLHYDFSTSWQNINNLEVIGHSDAIYKVMYEMMK